jgi:hypothetical protein
VRGLISLEITIRQGDINITGREQYEPSQIEDHLFPPIFTKFNCAKSMPRWNQGKQRRASQAGGCGI